VLLAWIPPTLAAARQTWSILLSAKKVSCLLIGQIALITTHGHNIDISTTFELPDNGATDHSSMAST